MRTWRLFLCKVVVSAVVAVSYAYAERPFATEDAKTGGKGILAFELSWDYVLWKAGAYEEIVLFGTSYGLLDNLDVVLELPYLSHSLGPRHRHQGLGDIAVSAKLLLVDEGDIHPALTLKGCVKTNSGNAERGLGTGANDYALIVAGTKSFGRLTLHGMAGYNAVGKNGDPNLRNIYLYGLAARYEFFDGFSFAAEVAGNDDPNRHSNNAPMAGLVGTSYTLSEHIVFDTALKFGLTPTAPLWNASAGVSVTL